MIEKYSRVYAAIDLDAIHSNMDHMKAGIAPETRIMAVIKADGYGHGAVPIAGELEPLDYVYGFATATVEESRILRHCGIRKPLLVLGYTFPDCYEELVQNNIRPTVFRYDMAGQLALCVRRLNEESKRSNPDAEDIRCRVHIKVDTGMSRIGIRPDETGIDFVKALLKMPEIEIEGIFTHFARADERDKTFAIQQIEVFENFTDRIHRETGYKIPICHCSNSAGILELKAANMNLVRAGITLYGLWPSGEMNQHMMELTPAMELRSRIVYIKEVEAGTPVSYGGTYITSRKAKIATIPIGYGDGYPRALSNKGFVLIKGRKAPVTGRICMDQFMVDVTDIPEAAEGDRVTLIGKDGGECITMEQLGELSGRFNYEFACMIGKRVPRVYLKSGRVIGTKDYFHDFK